MRFSKPLATPELLCDQELELFWLEEVQVLAQGVSLLHRATVGQCQIPQLVHVLEEQPLHLSKWTHRHLSECFEKLDTASEA